MQQILDNPALIVTSNGWVIVDSNIPCKVLAESTDPDRLARFFYNSDLDGRLVWISESGEVLAMIEDGEYVDGAELAAWLYEQTIDAA